MMVHLLFGEIFQAGYANGPAQKVHQLEGRAYNHQ